MGILVVLIAVVWALLAASIAAVLSLPLKRRSPLMVLFAPIIWGVLLPLPLLDEIVGKRQFDRLCEQNSKIQVDRSKLLSGRTVYLAKTDHVEISGTWLHVVLKPWRFVDATTGDIVVSYNTLLIDGGVISRSLSEGKVPLTFEGSCEPGGTVNPVKLLKSLGIMQIQTSDVHLEE